MNNYQKLLNNLGNNQAPDDLYEAVIYRLSTEQRLRIRRRFAVAVVSFVASVAAAFSAIFVLVSSLTTSGFWKFISLIFSDGATVVTYWQQFSLSLLESFSVLEMVASLTCVFAVILSLKFLIQNRKAFSIQGQLQLS